MTTLTDKQTAPKLVHTLNVFSQGLGGAIAWFTAAMVLITCVIVVLRYVLSTGSIALQESLSYLHAMVFMLGIGFTLKQDGHVRVDIFYRNFSPRIRAWVNLLGSLFLLLPVCLVIFYLSLDYVASSWAIRERSSENSGLPWIYLLKSLLLVMPTLLLLQGIAEFSKALLTLLGRDDPASGSDPNASTSTI